MGIDDLNKKLECTLQERGAAYGPYGTGLQIKEDLLNIIKNAYEEHHKMPMPGRELHYFWDICNKLCRLAINPNHHDSWRDVSGYATRILEDVEKMCGPENNPRRADEPR